MRKETSQAPLIYEPETPVSSLQAPRPLDGWIEEHSLEETMRLRESTAARDNGLRGTSID